MTPLKIKLLAGVAALVLLIGSNWGYRTYQEVGRLKQQLYHDMNIWIHMQWFAFGQFDYSLAGALSTSSVAKRQDFLEDAYQQAFYLAQYTSYGSSAVPSLHSLSGISYFWGESSRYLEYAGNEEISALKPSQLDTLQLISQYTSKMRPYMMELNDITNKAQYQSDSNEQVEQIVSKLAQEIGNLPAIGRNDKGFNDFWYSKYPYRIRKAGIVFEGEKKFNGAELARRAKSFMGDYWPKTNGQTIRSNGGGGDNLLGQSLSFGAYDDKKAMSSPYIVDVTKTGGHILRVYFEMPNGEKHDESLGELDKDKAISLAKEWIDRWGEEPLELYETKDEYTNLRLTFIPIRENIPMVQQKVDIVIDRKKGRLLELDATNYFMYYKLDVPLKPKLSPEEAAAKVNDLLEISGPLALQVRDGDLVYVIPVKGIERVTHLYINAIYGNEEGFEFAS
ncbi:PepSY1/2 domain-containing protein [Paenibacillus prosopidis]|uniref:YpeB-like sporulation protein n=1 Tax=Paenibacillus prosopidis TaxID=630520 RepID=A0A368W2C6_9BACL|nr:PepSY1/2 domain-containing protein [Paenibacillus prosopidis]RCW47418.1 YpeB-like sporulation protein [Paenibacillus prosopidis]